MTPPLPFLDLPDRRRARHESELEEPILSELFSIERLEQHAQTLAVAQRVTDTPGRGRRSTPASPRTAECCSSAYRILARAIKDERAITPAAEWLVDNYPIVDEQLREIRDDLPPDYYRELPKLAEGHLAGYPRVIGRGLGLRRAHRQPVRSRDPAAHGSRLPDRGAAHDRRAVGDRDLPAHPAGRQPPAARGADRARPRRPADGGRACGRPPRPRPNGPAPRQEPCAGSRRNGLPKAGRVQLFQRLRDQDPAVTPALGWLEELLAAQGTTAEETVRLEHQRQATMNVTVRNVITSMRLISVVRLGGSSSRASGRWMRSCARGAPSRTWTSRPGIATGTPWRNSPGGSGLTEVEVARRAVAATAAARSRRPRREPLQAGASDPGYYLISSGRPAFERDLGIRASVGRAAAAGVRALRDSGYLATIALVTALVLAMTLAAGGSGVAGVGLLSSVLVALGPASDLAISLVERVVTHLLGPRPLPRLDLDAGVPSPCGRWWSSPCC